MGSNGGAIYILDAELELSCDVVTYNEARYQGGVAFITGGSATLSNLTATANTADADPGIYLATPLGGSEELHLPGI